MLFTQVMSRITDGVAITDANARILDVNEALTRMTGFSRAELVGSSASCFEQKRAIHEIALRSTSMALPTEEWCRRKDGSVFPCRRSMVAVVGRRGKITHHVIVIADLTEHKTSEAHIERLAYYDGLTGLPNRLLMMDRLGQAINAAKRSGELVGVLVIDLDRFKHVNDSLGHPVGDQVLREVARRIEDVVRRADTVSRRGGDEFIVILSSLRNPSDAEAVTANIQAALEKPMPLAGRQLKITPSVGISLFPGDGQDAEMLIRCADTAMYHAKDNGRNNYQYFTAAMGHRAQERLALEVDLYAAFDAGEFSLHYQPQVHMASGALVGVEALLRWRRKDGSWIPPARFIPVAEECGLIQQLGAWVLEEACRQRQEWTRQGMGSFPVAVNFSALQFRQPDLPRFVIDTATRFGLAPGELELEITESVLMDNPAQSGRYLQELRAAGIGVSIDDFGTGYSSLSYLKQLPVNRLKIDASFVRDLENDPANRAIVQSIISLGRTLNISLVAEGVETVDAFQLLGALECDVAQGYGICPPVQPAQLTAWLMEWREGEAATVRASAP